MNHQLLRTVVWLPIFLSQWLNLWTLYLFSNFLTDQWNDVFKILGTHADEVLNCIINRFLCHFSHKVLSILLAPSLSGAAIFLHPFLDQKYHWGDGKRGCSFRRDKTSCHVDWKTRTEAALWVRQLVLLAQFFALNCTLFWVVQNFTRREYLSPKWLSRGNFASVNAA